MWHIAELKRQVFLDIFKRIPSDDSDICGNWFFHFFFFVF